MRLIFCFVYMPVALSISAQRIEKYFDYLWRPAEPASARFYALIEKKDSVWDRKDYFIHEGSMQMHGSYKDDLCKIAHGLFYYYHPDKKLKSTGNYINGKKDGLWVSYYANGMMKDSAWYINGDVTGTALEWHSNGYLSDSSVWNNDGSGV